MTAGASMDTGLQLRIHIEGIEPEIWRRLLVPAGMTVKELHDLVQMAMGWENDHLHEFEIGGDRYSSASGGHGPPKSEGASDGRRHAIGDLVGKGDTFAYLYDFGDGWAHRVKVEDVLESDEPYPLEFLGGERDCPPEDCGGTFGYYNMLEAMADPEHPDHGHFSEWAEDYDPEWFDPARLKASLDYSRKHTLKKAAGGKS